MTFANPGILAVGAGLWVAVLLLLVFASVAARRRLARFAAEPQLERLADSASSARALVRAGLVLAGLALALLAAAGPRWGETFEERPGRGVDLLFALDTSRSMLAEDLRPSRLERAKLAILDFVERLEGDRVGLVVFAGEAFLLCPPTSDYEAFRTSLEAVDTDIIPRPGTNLAAAIAEARATFGRSDRFRFLVLVTDGEELDDDGLAEARRAAAEGATIYTVGVGGEAGELIPVRGRDGGTSFLRDTSGALVRTKLDEERLRAIASAAGGFYAPLGPTAEGLARVYEDGLGAVPREEREGRRVRVPIERYAWPLAAAVVLLAAEFLVGTRRSRARGGIAAAALLASAGILLPPPAEAAPVDADARARFDAGDLEAAARSWEDLAARGKDPRLLFNAGAARLRGGKPAEAEALLDRALAGADPGLQRDILYNRGHARFAQVLARGPLQPPADPPTLEALGAARDDFAAAAELAPDDADAAFNRDALDRLIESLRPQEQPKEEEEPKEDEEQPKDEEQDPEQQDQQQQGGGEQPEPGDGQQPQPQGDQGDQQQPRDQGEQDPSAGDQQGDNPDGQGQQQPQQGQGQDQQGQQQPQQGEGQGQQQQEQQGSQGQQQGQPADQQRDQGQGQGQQPSPADQQLSPDPSQSQGSQGSQGSQSQGPQPQSRETAEGQSPSQPAGTAGAEPEASAPGRITRREAAALLESQEGRTRLLPFTRQAEGDARPPGRDW